MWAANNLLGQKEKRLETRTFMYQVDNISWVWSQSQRWLEVSLDKLTETLPKAESIYLDLFYLTSTWFYKKGPSNCFYTYVCMLLWRHVHVTTMSKCGSSRITCRSLFSHSTKLKLSGLEARILTLQAISPVSEWVSEFMCVWVSEFWASLGSDTLPQNKKNFHKDCVCCIYVQT